MRVCDVLWHFLGRSKLANLLFMKELQRRLDAEGSSILTISLHPGNVGTGKSRKRKPTLKFSS